MPFLHLDMRHSVYSNSTTSIKIHGELVTYSAKKKFEPQFQGYSGNGIPDINPVS